MQSSAHDDGRKHRPKHVEPTWNNKLTYIVASCWLLSQLYHDARIHERQTCDITYITQNYNQGTK